MCTWVQHPRGGCITSHLSPCPKLGAGGCCVGAGDPGSPQTQARGLLLSRKGAQRGISKGKYQANPIFFFCASFAPLPKSLNASSHLYYHLMVFPVSPLPTDTLSVPRWSPQIPRRDLGNSIKHRYGNPTAAQAESPPDAGG